MKARLLLAVLAMLCASLALAAPALASPYATTSDADQIDFTSARLIGAVGDDCCPSSPETMSWYFEYGKAANLTDATATPTQTAGTNNSPVFTTVENLDPDTTYYFRTVGERNGQTFRADIKSFKTKTHVPPTATTNDATDISSSWATIRGTVSADSTNHYFEWGTSPDALTNKTNELNTTGSVNRWLSGLAENTTYYFRVVAEKTDEPDAVGQTKSFKTLLSPGNQDDDSDGFKNSEDLCPNQPGVAASPYNQRGCPAPPDGDGDGFPDNWDGCPGQPGGAQGAYNSQGCPPPPDSDGDGYPDNFDGCPNEKGGANGPDNGQGCPRTDSDGDGYFDSEDQCAQGPPQFAVGGPASPENGNKQGCPVADEDKDGIADVHDKCPKDGNVYEMGEGGQFTDKLVKQVRPAGHKYAGCVKMNPVWYGRHATPMKDLIKYGADVNFICGGACKIKATLAFDAATTKKLKLKSSVIDTITDSAKGAANSQCTSCYMFNRIKLSASLKKKVAKLKSATLVLTVDMTDTKLGEKTKWGSKLVIGDKKQPKDLAEL